MGRSTITAIVISTHAIALFAAEPAKPMKTNRLAGESSAYLLQHAKNPVDWYPWGPEAFAKAQKEGKLIFLSIGYSSCHWCHVMERETFENVAVANMLNADFVCIKVDREERPDIDDVYLAALQVTGVNGGWPMSLFLTPEGKPIFGGTYFPPDDKKVDDDTIPGFKSILTKVLELHKNKKKEIYAQADRIAELTHEEMDRQARIVNPAPLDASVIADALAAYELDPVYGGLGSQARGYRGTKFPRVAALHFLLNQSTKKGQENLAKAVALTLDQMAAGGIRDHLGGGFHRYSTERTWTVPHFEKMLYDNAQLVELYCDAYRLAPNENYRRVIESTLAFVAREMTAPEGWFYSALDADSGGIEGEFYVWTAKELDSLLGTAADAALFRRVYSLEKPNFEETKFILRLSAPIGALAKDAKLSEDELLKKLEPQRKTLYEARAKRERPFRDAKLITAWNGQMIAAYARAGEVLKNPEYTRAAEKAAEFLLKNQRDKKGRWLRIGGVNDKARVPAFLDDHAFLIHGFLNLHAATGDAKWLAEAKSLAALQDRWFGDETRGGYYTTASDAEKLFARGKDRYDGAQPSGNGVSAGNLLRLNRLTKDGVYRQRAEKLIRYLGFQLQSGPTAVPLACEALGEILSTGGLMAEESLRPPMPPANPKNSADVVSVAFHADGVQNQSQSFTVTLAVAKPWHIYANPSLSDEFVASATTVEIVLDDKPIPATIDYPAGTELTDPNGKQRVYEGTVTIRGTVKRADAANGKLSVRVKLVACGEKTCLLPSTLKAEAK